MVPFSSSTGQEWQQITLLLLAVALSSTIGIERQLRQKAAGLRTNTLVGTGSALFTLVSKYGFSDILSEQRIMLDPSRVTAQIVSGIGFIGGGIIFKQASEVRGLTTAAAVWLTSAVGTACGAGLPILASVATGLYFVTVVLFPVLWMLGRVLVLRVRGDGRVERRVGVMVRYRCSVSMGLEPIFEKVLEGAESVKVRRIDEVFVEGKKSSPFHGPVQGVNGNGNGNGGAGSPNTPQSASGREDVSALAISGGRTFDVHLLVSGHKSPNEVVSLLSRLQSVIAVAIDDGPIDEV
ncbi:Mg2+ transporter MgtC family protein [Penicillium angulare]|uniref:Mg2+ transporter MgtC family protein n=1 Tax=Penicillium angulare TaxID=116970 RepID=A0A9W9FAI6_9EURO|nr:Mg2+ transporter MgtC family protein [Penicillium angulare]